ncbi:hypothetical protein [Kocuria marina]|uniref:hypothetical protein n=1 Tax=Kocuria TaxID=57493 RepID=UPI001876882C|nr:hypothetical protein GCM10007061_21500 [Kocuria marina]
MTEPPASRRARLPKRAEWTARGHLGPAVVILPHDVQDMKMPELGPENWLLRSIAVAPSTAEASEQDSVTPSPSVTATPTASEAAVTAGALTQTFTTPGGTTSFRYPTNWTVAPSATSIPSTVRGTSGMPATRRS